MAKNISLATFNLHNLQVADGHVYGRPVSAEKYAAQKTWTAAMLKQLDADVIFFQELWAKPALEDVFEAAGLNTAYSLRYIGDSFRGASIAAAVRAPWSVHEQRTHKDFPPGFKLLKRRRGADQDEDRHDDEVDVKIDRFSRTVLHLVLRHNADDVPDVHALGVHLKSKLPTNLDAAEAGDGIIGPNAEGLGSALSTVRRTAEAAALRVILNDLMNDNEAPVVVAGDFNDGLLSNTLSIITAQPPFKLFEAKRTSQAMDQIDLRDRGLYSSSMLQQYHSLRDVYYSHNHHGVLESLDHILVSEQFYDHAPDRKWSFKVMRIWNDHLDEYDPRVPRSKQDRSATDHGVVRTEFLWDPV